VHSDWLALVWLVCLARVVGHQGFVLAVGFPVRFVCPSHCGWFVLTCGVVFWDVSVWWLCVLGSWVMGCMGWLDGALEALVCIRLFVMIFPAFYMCWVLWCSSYCYGSMSSYVFLGGHLYLRFSPLLTLVFTVRKSRLVVVAVQGAREEFVWQHCYLSIITCSIVVVGLPA